MDGYTAVPDDDYDVLVHDAAEAENVSAPTESCAARPTGVLAAWQTPWLFSAVCAVGLLDSVTLAFLLARTGGLRRAGNAYLLHLAAARVCFLLPLPFWAHPLWRETPPGALRCRVVAGCHAAALCAQVFFLVLLALQSYQASFPAPWLSPGLETAAGKIVTGVLAWGLAVLVPLPELAFSKPPPERERWKCAWGQPPFAPTAAASWRYLLTAKLSLVSLALPLAVWLFCGLRRRRRGRLSLGAPQDDLSRLVFTLTLVFLLLWAPYHVALLLWAAQPPSAWLQDCERGRALHAGVQITGIVALAHCGVGALLSWALDAACRSRARRPTPACGSGPLEPTDQHTCVPNSSRQPPNHSTPVKAQASRSAVGNGRATGSEMRV